MSNPIKALLVDDHDAIRVGIRVLLQRHGIVVIGEASDGSGAIQLAAELEPDIIIMDVHMPGMDGIEATRQITAKGSRVRVIAFSASDTSWADQMLDAGASDFVRKDRAFDSIFPSIS